MFISWQKSVGGRVRADPRFSARLTWNTFPLPEPTPVERMETVDLARAVLEQRALHAGQSLDTLYSPNATPAGLLRAHKALDGAVDRLFSGRERAQTDRDRQRVLFQRFVELEQAGALTASGGRRRR